MYWMYIQKYKYGSMWSEIDVLNVNAKENIQISKEDISV